MTKKKKKKKKKKNLRAIYVTLIIWEGLSQNSKKNKNKNKTKPKKIHSHVYVYFRTVYMFNVISIFQINNPYCKGSFIISMGGSSTCRIWGWVMTFLMS